MTLSNVLLSIVLATSLLSCKKDIIGDGPITTETRTVQNFTSIELQMNGNVYYRNDPQWKLEISARESIHDILETNVINGKLVIRYYNGKTYDNDESIRITVSGPGVNNFVTTTSGNIIGENEIIVSNIGLHSSGSGNILISKVTATSLEAQSLQSGKVSVGAGTVNTENLKSDGSGTVDMRSVQAKYAYAYTKGSGDIRVKVSERLEAKIYGSGWVLYYGWPVVSRTVVGSGKVERAD
jgi:hypothetical protein